MSASSGPSQKLTVPETNASRAWLRTLSWALAAVGACMFLLTAWFVISEHDAERVVPGVKLAELSVSGLDRKQLAGRLGAWDAEHVARRVPLTLTGSALVFEPKSVGFALNVPASSAQALAVGRSGNFFSRLIGFIARRFKPQVLQPELRFDAALLNASFDSWQASIKDPPFVGGITTSGVTVIPNYPRSGVRLDRARAQAQLASAFITGEAIASLATRSEAPGVERAEVDRLVALAQGMVGAGIELSSKDGAERLQLSPLQVASLLQVQPAAEHGQLELGCSVAAAKQLLDPERAKLEKQPENARFVIDAQGHVQVEPGRSGLVLNDAAVARAACMAAASPDKRAGLPLEPGAEPALTTEVAEHAGIVGLMGTYTTHHACCQPRVQNIHHIADLLDGTLVRPGETFSVNQLIGPRTVKNGFRPAPSIEDGDMVDTVGGGVSQFATTLFNALFYGGYDILERQPHSYWFTRYPMGYDATLSYPHPDIVFKNDTNAGALIKTEYTDTSITVKIYGDNGGRRVRAEVSPRQNIVLPPVEYVPNRSLEADEEKTREGGMIGWTVTVKRTLTFPDGKIKEEHRKVTYKPRARRVEVHPCRIPEGEPGHTGERCPKPDPDKEQGKEASGPADPSAK
ncbi:MAG: VanW family protein [Pseudomonadota bacterium]